MSAPQGPTGPGDPLINPSPDPSTLEIPQAVPAPTNPMGKGPGEEPPDACLWKPGPPPKGAINPPDRILRGCLYQQSMLKILSQVAAKAGVDWLLLWSIMKKETDAQPIAFMDQRSGHPSFGLMQIDCGHDAVGRNLRKPCTRQGLNPNDPYTKLLLQQTPWKLMTDCLTNVYLAALLLKENLINAGGDIPLAVGRYNAGSYVQHPIPNVTDKNGNNPFEYVQTVGAYYSQAGGDTSKWVFP